VYVGARKRTPWRHRWTRELEWEGHRPGRSTRMMEAQHHRGPDFSETSTVNSPMPARFRKQPPGHRTKAEHTPAIFPKGGRVASWTRDLRPPGALEEVSCRQAAGRGNGPTKPCRPVRARRLDISVSSTGAFPWRCGSQGSDARPGRDRVGRQTPVLLRQEGRIRVLFRTEALLAIQR